MDGARRRLALASITLALAACTPRPPATTTPAPSLTTTPARTPAATATPASSPGPSASTAPTSIDLPPGLDAIPWAHFDPANDLVTIGVLGRLATTTRSTTFEGEPARASGRAVLVTTEAGTEVVDAATGITMATFDRDDLALSTEGVPDDDLSYAFAPSGFLVDVERGFLYDLAANLEGIQLRRFALDGSDETLLAVLAPDPGREFWEAVDVVLGPAGDVIATACPPREASDQRCRLWTGAAGAELTRRFLPLDSHRPCFLLAASERFLIGSSLVGCRADGGPPQVIPYIAIDLRTRATREVWATSRFTVLGVEDPPPDEDGPEQRWPTLIGNAGAVDPWPSFYPAIAASLTFDYAIYAVERIGTADGPGLVEVLRGHGPGWTVSQQFGAPWVDCVMAADPSVPDCPRGPVTLTTDEASWELPPGTYGEILPPTVDPGWSPDAPFRPAEDCPDC
jgi:hypothetical protein